MANKFIVGFAVLIVCHVATANALGLLSFLANRTLAPIQPVNVTNLLAQGLANLQTLAAANPTNTLLSGYLARVQAALNGTTTLRFPVLRLNTFQTQLAQALTNLRSSTLSTGLSNLQTLLQNLFGGATAAPAPAR